MNREMLERINKALPQTQCRKCGFDGCEPYAQALIAGAEINRCPPGGDSTIKILSSIMGTSPLPLDSSYGKTKAKAEAYIHEKDCIGCTKCITACPVDAIIGAAKLMHTVLKEECSGCDLCVKACPVDCIEMRSEKIYHSVGQISNSEFVKKQRQAVYWRERFDNRNQRHDILKERKIRENKNSTTTPFSREEARKEILAAISRTQAKRELMERPR
jgi:RnfABCDGE-type electron transport complex B subunit